MQNFISHNISYVLNLLDDWFTSAIGAVNAAASSYLLFKYKFSKTALGMMVFKRAVEYTNRESYIRQTGEVHVTYRKYKRKRKIDSPETSVKVFKSIWDKDLFDVQEQLYVIFLDTQDHLICWKRICVGSHKACIVDIRQILMLALNCKCYKIIMAHNHPCGVAKPSKADYEITEKVMISCMAAEIELLDHVIITKDSFFSFKVETEVLN